MQGTCNVKTYKEGFYKEQSISAIYAQPAKARFLNVQDTYNGKAALGDFRQVQTACNDKKQQNKDSALYYLHALNKDEKKDFVR